jgi:hypothetical protein
VVNKGRLLYDGPVAALRGQRSLEEVFLNMTADESANDSAVYRALGG